MMRISVVTCCLMMLVMTGGSRPDNRVRDLLILLDDSADITDNEWTSVKRQLKDLIWKLCGLVGPESVSTNRLSVVTFSTNVLLRLDMREFSRLPEYLNAIRGMTQTKGTDRCLVRALDFATETLSALPRSPRRAREVLILSAGEATSCPGLTNDIAAATRRLQSEAFVFALRFNALRGPAQLASLVSTSFKDHIFSLSNFNSFDSMVDSIKFYPRLCIPFELS